MNYHISTLLLISLTIVMARSQKGLPSINSERFIELDGKFKYYSDLKRPDQYYFLPLTLALKANKEGEPMFLFMSYSANGKDGIIFNSHFTFEPGIRSDHLTESLRKKNDAANYAGPYPFYREEKIYQKSGENIELSLDLIKGNQIQHIGNYPAYLNVAGITASTKFSGDTVKKILESLSNPTQGDLVFSTHLELQQAKRSGEVVITFNPKQLAVALLIDKDQFSIAKEDFELQLLEILKADHLIKTSNASAPWKDPDLTAMIIDRVWEVLFESETGLTTSIHSSQTVIRRESHQRVIINGEIVEEKADTTTQQLEVPKRKYHPIKNLVDKQREYPLGPMEITKVPYVLHFNLSEFYRNNSNRFNK